MWRHIWRHILLLSVNVPLPSNCLEYACSILRYAYIFILYIYFPFVHKHCMQTDGCLTISTILTLNHYDTFTPCNLLCNIFRLHMRHKEDGVREQGRIKGGQSRDEAHSTIGSAIGHISSTGWGLASDPHTTPYPH